ncbi:MAG: hypothetical protein J5772_09215 [Clostridia bacterium]|nr:hypothetical protein [Clostridia bacterium]
MEKSIKTKMPGRNGVPFKSGKRTYRYVANAKGIRTLIALVLALIVIEGALAAVWFFGCDYAKREANESNTRAVTLTDPTAGFHHPGSTSRIEIMGNGEGYTFFYIPRAKLSRAELVDAINAEPVLNVTVRNDDKVCAISGEKEVYLSLEDYNAYHKNQCTIGKWFIGPAAAVVFAALGLVIFAKLRDRDYLKAERVKQA